MAVRAKSPVDDSVWGQSMDAGFSRFDQPGYVMRLVPGADPTNTALTEVYATPEGTWGPRGLDLTSEGVVWVALASGHLGSLDRRKCKGPLNGPQAADGKICPEGWTVYRMPGPQFKGVDEKGSANHAYYIWVDRDNTLGLGKNVPVASANGSESLLAVVDGKLVDICVCRIRSASSPRTSTAASMIRMRAGKARDCGRRSAAARSSTTKAARRTGRRSTSCRSRSCSCEA